MTKSSLSCALSAVVSGLVLLGHSGAYVRNSQVVDARHDFLPARIWNGYRHRTYERRENHPSQENNNQDTLNLRQDEVTTQAYTRPPTPIKPMNSEASAEKTTTKKYNLPKAPIRPYRSPEDLDEVPTTKKYHLPKAPVRPYRNSHTRTPILNILHEFVYPRIEVFSYKSGNPYIEEADNVVMDTRPFSRRSPPPSSGSDSRRSLCGGEFDGLSGTVSSPSYPFNYPNSIRCVYTISVPAGYTIGLDCNDFSIQPGDLDCENDYLEVYRSGDTVAEDANKYCGDKALGLFSVANNMTLIFQSDGAFRYRGFLCRYRALNPDGTGAEGMVISNSTADEHPIICTGPGDSGWAGKCGVSFTPGTRIVGGTSVDKHQFPWMGAILKECGKDLDHYCHICGGTVIHEQWILTGAHCIISVPVERLGVLLGDHNLYTLTPSQKFFRIEATYVHPDFNVPSPLNNDVALIKFPQEISFSRHIAPVCMPPRNAMDLLNLIPRIVERSGRSASINSKETVPADAAEVAYRQQVTTTAEPPFSHVLLRESLVDRNVSVYGWGTTSDDGGRGVSLRTVSVKILANDECDYYYGVMTDTMMCTSGEGGHGPCIGDSGSPAQLQMVDGRWVQIGVLAFGAAYGCEVGYPSGNVLLPVFVDWIEYITGVDFTEYN